MHGGKEVGTHEKKGQKPQEKEPVRKGDGNQAETGELGES